MTHSRRSFVQLAAGAAVFSQKPHVALAETQPTQSPPEPSARPLAERLAAYADGLHYDDLDAATIERVKSHVIDTLGCGIAAFDEPPVRMCREVAFAPSTGTATVIGSNRRTTADLASFANGAAFRYHDLNDVYVGLPSGHPSDNIAACLAVAEAERATAAELITAIVLAYEVNCRLIDAFDIATPGWDAPVFSLPAVALAAGKLMKLPLERLVQAVNLAINDHIPMGQTRAESLSDWKGFADAEAARNAVFAATLARAGITGPSPIFEGRAGFFRLVSGNGDVNVDAFGRRGIPFKIHQCGMKAYPVVVYAQTAVVAATAVAKETAGPDRIDAIEIATTRRGYEQAGSDPEKWTPDTRGTADHSLPYIVARAMLDGEVNNGSYAPDKLREPRILAFMRKITVKQDSDIDKLRGNAPATRITAVLRDGQRITRQVESMPGFEGQPMSRADVDQKFRGNVGTRWPQERTEAILRTLWALDNEGDVNSLLGRFSTPA